MNEKDKREKLLEDYNDVFADIYNTLLFEESLLDEKHLDFGQTESIFKLDDKSLKEQRRDVLKKYADTNLCVLSVGIENQTKTDKTMPFRVMSYDVGTYMGYIKNKMPVSPVITIVLNFADEKWNCGTGLHDVLDIPKELKPYVADYKIHVFDIAFLEDSTIDKFKSDFKLIARFFKEKRLGIVQDNLLKDKTNEIHHVEEVLGMMRALTNDARFAYTDEVRALVKKGEKVHMCEALDAYFNEKLSEVTRETTINVHMEYFLSGVITLEEVMAKTGLSEKEVLERAEDCRVTYNV